MRRLVRIPFAFGALILRENSYEQRVAHGSAPPTTPTAGPPGAATPITRAQVWGLWNEGNLFSLSVPELQTFLREQCKEEVDAALKKSALVRRVEEIMQAEQPATKQLEDTVASITSDAHDYGATGTDLFEEADVYGDWDAVSNFEDKRELDFMELSPTKLQEQFDPLSPRAFQLLHDEATADVGLSKFNATKLPGQKKSTETFTPTTIQSDDANKIRFRRAFKWCITNLWNMNIPGELNIGAGKALYWRSIAKYNKNVLPVWTCQTHLYSTHPYTWFPIAHESNTAAIEDLALKLGMKEMQAKVLSYRLTIARGRDKFDCDLNDQLGCTSLTKPWDRFLVSHVLRNKMPDLRYLVRARHPLKKRFAEAYFEASILALSNSSVKPVLPPDLGEVSYCCERTIRKWGTKLPKSGVLLQIVETKRNPLIVQREGDEGERLEYELIAQLPQQAERVDAYALSDDLWEHGNQLALVLESGMQELNAHVMPSAAAFDPISA